MKLKNLYSRLLVILVCLVFISSSCQKANQQGDLKVVVHYNSHTNGTLVYTLTDKPKVELLNDDRSLVYTEYATQYATGTDPIDFGNYNFGSYIVKVTGNETWIDSRTAQTGNGGDYSKSDDFNIDASTKTITVEIP